MSWPWADLSADSHSRFLELEAGDLPSRGDGMGPSRLLSCHLPQAVGGILSGGSELSLFSCWGIISFAVVGMSCMLAPSSYGHLI